MQYLMEDTLGWCPNTHIQVWLQDAQVSYPLLNYSSRSQHVIVYEQHYKYFTVSSHRDNIKAVMSS